MTQSEINNKLTALIGQKIDYDGWYGHQCVDLVYYVLRDIYGMKNWLNLRNGAAKDMAEPIAYREFASQLEFIPNTPEFVPQAGDICVTLGGQYNNRWGHVFMILAGSTVNTMNTLEQNTGNGDGRGEDDRTVARTRNYANILTFVRWKGIQSNTTININNNQDMELKNQMKNIIATDTRYDEETRRMLLAAVDNGDMAYVLAFSGAYIRDELQSQQYKRGEIELAYNNLLNSKVETTTPTLETYVAQQLQEVPAVPPFTLELTKEQTEKLDEQEVQNNQGRPFGISKKLIVSLLSAFGVPTTYLSLVEFLPEQVVIDPNIMSQYALPVLGMITVIACVYIISQAIIDYKNK
jgi:hypothetical protein